MPNDVFLYLMRNVIPLVKEYATNILFLDLYIDKAPKPFTSVNKMFNVSSNYIDNYITNSLTILEMKFINSHQSKVFHKIDKHFYL